MVIKLSTFILLGQIWFGTATAYQVKEGCADLNGAGVKTRMEYLDRDRSSQSPACVIYAIEQLGNDRYVPAATTLAKYLDYRLPERPATGEPIVSDHRETMGRVYPAVTSLFQIGKPAVPILLTVISAGSTADRARANAIDALFAIYRDDVPEGAAVLNSAGRAATDVEIRQRLLDAARQYAGMCSGIKRGACLSNALR
jgi:hypothetical protein